MPDPSIAAGAERIARHAERELEALVGVSSPSGDVRGADEAVAVAAALVPEEAEITRPPCSTTGQARDLLVHLRGTGSRRVLLLGHLDTVVARDAHQPLRREGDRLYGSGSVDMKGGVVLALGVLRELAAHPERYAELALLLVVDEEWRTVPLRHARDFDDWDACLCFEAGERTRDGAEGVVVRRKAAGTLRVRAHGRAAHSGSAPDRGANALLALAAAAQAVAGRHDPHGPLRLTAVPTVVRAGDAFNVVPAAGELLCDLRCDELAAFDDVIGAIPATVDEVRLEAGLDRAWPSMDARQATSGLLERATERLGRAVRGTERGGASDASFVAPGVPLTVDGLGPRGGGAHTPEEHVLTETLRSRAEVALAVAGAALEP
jgi:glutamate carboxypeptidase